VTFVKRRREKERERGRTVEFIKWVRNFSSEKGEVDLRGVREEESKPSLESE
jgi:hypothetical protein